MNIDFQEILKELEYRVPHGIINLNEEHQVTMLVDILRENGVDDANHLAQKARGVDPQLTTGERGVKRVRDIIKLYLHHINMLGLRPNFVNY